MKQLWVLTLTVAMLVAAPLAEAKRMGGGSSLGRQIQQRLPSVKPPRLPLLLAEQTADSSNRGKPMPPPAEKAFGGRCHAGRLATGLGFAWLASSLGLGEGFANILMIRTLVMAGLAIFRMVKRSSQAASASGAGAAPFPSSAMPRPGCSGRCVDPSGTSPRKVGK